jgi:hypothetical protein
MVDLRGLSPWGSWAPVFGPILLLVAISIGGAVWTRFKK